MLSLLEKRTSDRSLFLAGLKRVGYVVVDLSHVLKETFSFALSKDRRISKRRVVGMFKTQLVTFVNSVRGADALVLLWAGAKPALFLEAERRLGFLSASEPSESPGPRGRGGRRVEATEADLSGLAPGSHLRLLAERAAMSLVESKKGELVTTSTPPEVFVSNSSSRGTVPQKLEFLYKSRSLEQRGTAVVWGGEELMTYFLTLKASAYFAVSSATPANTLRRPLVFADVERVREKMLSLFGSLGGYLLAVPLLDGLMLPRYPLELEKAAEALKRFSPQLETSSGAGGVSSFPEPLAALSELLGERGTDRQEWYSRGILPARRLVQLPDFDPGEKMVVSCLQLAKTLHRARRYYLQPSSLDPLFKYDFSVGPLLYDVARVISSSERLDSYIRLREGERHLRLLEYSFLVSNPATPRLMPLRFSEALLRLKKYLPFQLPVSFRTYSLGPPGARGDEVPILPPTDLYLTSSAASEVLSLSLGGELAVRYLRLKDSQRAKQLGSIRVGRRSRATTPGNTCSVPLRMYSSLEYLDEGRRRSLYGPDFNKDFIVTRKIVRSMLTYEQANLLAGLLGRFGFTQALEVGSGSGQVTRALLFGGFLKVVAVDCNSSNVNMTERNASVGSPPGELRVLAETFPGLDFAGLGLEDPAVILDPDVTFQHPPPQNKVDLSYGNISLRRTIEILRREGFKGKIIARIHSRFDARKLPMAKIINQLDSSGRTQFRYWTDMGTKDIRVPRSLGGPQEGERLSEEDVVRLFGQPRDVLFTEEGIFSATPLEHFEAMYSRLGELFPLLGDRPPVRDLSAGIGTDTFHFLSKGHQVTSIERDRKTFQVLSHNVGGMRGASLVLGDALDHLGGDCSLVYVDAPWGGPGFRERREVPAYVGEGGQRVDVEEVARRLVCADALVFKLPHYVDFDVPGMTKCRLDLRDSRGPYYSFLLFVKRRVECEDTEVTVRRFDYRKYLRR